jgi:hypothetical protein
MVVRYDVNGSILVLHDEAGAAIRFALDFNFQEDRGLLNLKF